MTRRAALLVVTTVVALTAAGSAEAAPVTFSDCTIEALKPTPVKFNSSGRKYALAQASVSCSSERSVEAELNLMGDDPVFDDLQTPGKKSLDKARGTHTLVPTWAFYFAYGCNEDRPGDDELYSRVRARTITISSGTSTPTSAWSKWTNSSTVSYDCG